MASSTYYVNWTTGNDNITAITNATFTESTKNLNKTAAFANYTVNMRINIDGGTAVVTGLYKVVTVTDDDNVVLESTITSDASDPTDVSVEASVGTSEGDAWATIDHSMNQVAAGDKVWVKASADYNETVDVNIVGSLNSWIVFEGYTTTPGLGGKVTIDGESTRTSGITASTGSTYYRFENFILENHTGDGFKSATADSMVWVNCEFNNSGGDGCDTDNAHTFANCSALGNTGSGWLLDLGARFINCTAGVNTNRGWLDVAGGTILYNCVSYSNGVYGISVGGGLTAGAAMVMNCTVDGNSKDSDTGFRTSNDDYAIVLANNIFYDCVTGISGNTNPHTASQIGLNNLVNSNTTAYTKWFPSGTDVTGAPNFTDEASLDYTLGSGSSAIDAGSDYSGSSSPGMDIGAHQTAPAGGGAQRWVGGVPFTW